MSARLADVLAANPYPADRPHLVNDYISAELDFVDALRTFDVENAAAERRDLESELDRDDAPIIDRVITDDDLMILTWKNVFISQAYLNTMRRVAEISRDKATLWQDMRREMIRQEVDLFAGMDRSVESGLMTYGQADAWKRKIRTVCRPHIGPKRKPSKNRR
jgi:hypothetical protein